MFWIMQPVYFEGLRWEGSNTCVRQTQRTFSFCNFHFFVQPAGSNWSFSKQRNEVNKMTKKLTRWRLNRKDKTTARAQNGPDNSFQGGEDMLRMMICFEFILQCSSQRSEAWQVSCFMKYLIWISLFERLCRVFWNPAIECAVIWAPSPHICSLHFSKFFHQFSIQPYSPIQTDSYGFPPEKNAYLVFQGPTGYSTGRCKIYSPF